MKAILLATTLALCSNTVLSHTLSEVSLIGGNPELIKKALNDELTKTAIECDYTKGEMSNSVSKSYLRKLILDDKTLVTSDSNQPVIHLSNESDPVPTNTAKYERNLYKLSFKTTADYKKILEVQISDIKEIATSENTGTLKDPYYEVVKKYATQNRGSCINIKESRLTRVDSYFKELGIESSSIGKRDADRFVALKDIVIDNKNIKAFIPEGHSITVEYKYKSTGKSKEIADLKIASPSADNSRLCREVFYDKNDKFTYTASPECSRRVWLALTLDHVMLINLYMTSNKDKDHVVTVSGPNTLLTGLDIISHYTNMPESNPNGTVARFDSILHDEVNPGQFVSPLGHKVLFKGEMSGFYTNHNSFHLNCIKALETSQQPGSCEVIIDGKQYWLKPIKEFMVLRENGEVNILPDPLRG